MKWLLAFLLSFWAMVPVAMGQEPMACEGFWCTLLGNFPELGAWAIAIFTFLSVVLRATAELVLFVSKKLDHEKTGEWGKRISSWGKWAGQLLGWFGAGVPKAVLEEKAKKLDAGK